MKTGIKIISVCLMLILSVCACGKRELIDSEYDNVQEETNKIEIPLKEEELWSVKMCGDVVLFETISSETQEFYYVEDVKKFPQAPVCTFDYCERDIIDYITDGKGYIYFIAIDEGEEGPKLIRLNLGGEEETIRTFLDFQQEETDDLYSWNVRIEPNGHILITSNYGYCVLDNEGEIVREEYWEKKEIYDVLFPGEGYAFIQQIENINRVFIKIDLATEQIKKLDEISINARLNLMGSRDNQVFMFTDSEAYIYDIAGEKSTRLFAWTDLGIVGENVIGMYGDIEESHCIVKESNYLYDIQWNGRQGGEEKVELTLGCTVDSSVTRRAVAQFNSINRDCRITIIDYSGEGENVAAEKMYMDILAGKGPDIIQINSNYMDERILGERGILENLVPYLEYSDVIGTQDMVTSVYDALVTNQKIYMLPTNFKLTGVITKKRWVPDTQKWTVNDIFHVLEEQPELSENSYIDRNTMLELCFPVCFNAQNQNQGVALDRAILEKYICLAEHMPQTAVYPAEESVRREGELFFEVFFIEGMNTFLYNKSAWGEDAVFIGYPEGSGNGMMIIPDNCYSVSSVSKHKELAWKFIESFFSNEWQREITPNYYFSICKDKLDEQLQQSMQRNMYVGSDGYQRELPVMQYDMDGETIAVYAAREEDVAQLRKMIEEATMIRRGDSPLITIIQEEAAYYFSGDKTLEQVIDIIQNRIQLYVDEQQ